MTPHWFALEAVRLLVNLKLLNFEPASAVREEWDVHHDLYRVLYGDCEVLRLSRYFVEVYGKESTHTAREALMNNCILPSYLPNGL